MATEIPRDLIKQIQISLRREANVSSYDAGDVSLHSFPTAAEAIAEIDPCPPYLRCKHCKGRLLRGIESLICVFCGKQQRTSDNPPDNIKFICTAGYRWLLSSLQLNGSEIVETTKEADGLNRGQKAPIKEIPLSNLLDLEIQWHQQEEELTASSSDKASAQGKIPLNLGGLDLGSFFIEERRAAPEVQSEQDKPIGSTDDNDFKDPRSLSLFENVDATGPSKLQQPENLGFFEKKDVPGKFSSQGNISFFEGKDARESSFSKEQENLSLFEKKGAQENSFSKEHGNISLFEGKGAKKSSTSQEQGNVGLFESVQLSDAAEKSEEDNIGDSSSNWKVGFQSDGKRTLPQEPESVDPFISSSVDLSAHMDSLFGSGKDSIDAKPKDSSAASGSNAGDWFQDDLFSNRTRQGHQSDSTVHDNDVGIKTDASGTSSMNIDWIKDDLWQTSTSKTPDKKSTDYEDVDWNDFATSTNLRTPNSSSSQSGVETFDGTRNARTGEITDSGKSSSRGMDWNDDEKWQIGTNTVVPHKTKNQTDDLFDSWNDFTGSTVSQGPSISCMQHSADPAKPSVEQNTETNLCIAANDQQGSDFGGFSQPDFFCGGFSNQNNSVEVNSVQSEISTSDRAAAASDLFSANAKAKTDDIEMLMSQMHDLSFMLECKLSMPSNPKP